MAAAPAGSGFSVGDRVTSFTMLNGLAEQVAVSPELAMRIPDSMTLAEGASLPMNYLTMEFALIRRAALQPGETVLIHGAAGGIGTAGIQIFQALGATVVAVASSESKRRSHFPLEPTMRLTLMASWVPQRNSPVAGGVDVVVDPVGGERFTDSLRCLAPEGRLFVIGFTAGDIPSEGEPTTAQQH